MDQVTVLNPGIGHVVGAGQSNTTLLIEHCPLVMWQSLSQSETFLPLNSGQPQPIRFFPTIEPSILQCHNAQVV